MTERDDAIERLKRIAIDAKNRRFKRNFSVMKALEFRANYKPLTDREITNVVNEIYGVKDFSPEKEPEKPAAYFVIMEKAREFRSARYDKDAAKKLIKSIYPSIDDHIVSLAVDKIYDIYESALNLRNQDTRKEIGRSDEDLKNAIKEMNKTDISSKIVDDIFEEVLGNKQQSQQTQARIFIKSTYDSAAKVMEAFLTGKIGLDDVRKFEETLKESYIPEYVKKDILERMESNVSEKQKSDNENKKNNREKLKRTFEKARVCYRQGYGIDDAISIIKEKSLSNTQLIGNVVEKVYDTYSASLNLLSQGVDQDSAKDHLKTLYASEGTSDVGDNELVSDIIGDMVDEVYRAKQKDEEAEKERNKPFGDRLTDYSKRQIELSTQVYSETMKELRAPKEEEIYFKDTAQKMLGEEFDTLKDAIEQTDTQDLTKLQTAVVIRAYFRFISDPKINQLAQRDASIHPELTEILDAVKKGELDKVEEILRKFGVL